MPPDAPRAAVHRPPSTVHRPPSLRAAPPKPAHKAARLSGGRAQRSPAPPRAPQQDALMGRGRVQASGRGRRSGRAPRACTPQPQSRSTNTRSLPRAAAPPSPPPIFALPHAPPPHQTAPHPARPQWRSPAATASRRSRPSLRRRPGHGSVRQVARTPDDAGGTARARACGQHPECTRARRRCEHQ